MELKYIALLACLLLLIFLLYKEIKRANTARIFSRILASIIAVSCFYFLLVPLQYQSHLERKINEIILLTEGVNPDTIAQLKGEKYVLASANSNSKAKPIPDLVYFLKSRPEITKLNIYGYGLTDEELKFIKGYEISFHPSAKPTGVIAASWPTTLQTSELLHVQGTYQNANDKPIKLLLQGFGNPIDSLLIEANANKSFFFKDRPKQSGQASYQLIALQNKDTLAKETVPFQVVERTPMKVLILASFPDFEYKFLKKWLYENQYPLAFKSQISKNKYATDFLNMERFSLEQINASSLNKFDLLIIDEEELAAISPNERASISSAVDHGMGLLISISNQKPLTTLSARFPRYESPIAKDRQLSLTWIDDKFRFNKLPLEQTLFLKANANDQPLVADASGKILVNSTIKGYGKVVISTVSATYNWLLSGKTTAYATYWSGLLVKTARKQNAIQKVNIMPQFPVLHQKTRIIADLAESGKVPTLKVDDMKLSPRQNMELPFQWDAIYWPQNVGWANLSINQKVESFYIYQKTDWQALKNQHILQSNLQFIKNSKALSEKNTSTSIVIAKAISKWWFFIGFLLATGFLWYESRILNA